MVRRLKAFANCHRSTVIAAHVANNLLAWRNGRRSTPVSVSGATHRGLDLDVSLGYIDDVYEDYLRYGGMRSEDLVGARVLEVGAGDNFGVALRLLAAGAAEVVCLDRFVTRRDETQQQKLNIELLARLGPVERQRVADAIASDGSLVAGCGRLRVQEGVPIEQAEGLLGTNRFDVILSRAVLEHVMSVEDSLAVMDRLLVRGGLMLHKADLRDHGMFSAGGMHPLTYLTVSQTAYRYMTSHTGCPNRTRISGYRSTLHELDYDVHLLITHQLGVTDEVIPHAEQLVAPGGSRHLVHDIRPRLAAPFVTATEDDLLVEGVFVIARKPVARPSRALAASAGPGR